MSKMLEEEFVELEQELVEKIERYREICFQLGFDFRDNIEDVIDQVGEQY